jgi:Family of unknown function (DUF5519)
MKFTRKLEEEISTWPNVSVHSHRFGGKEFCVGNAEVGHVHENGIVDMPFPRSIRDALLAENLAEEHHWVPNSGWITFRLGSEDDLNHAVWLMRLSYLRYALKAAVDPSQLLEQQGAELRLTPQFQSLFQALVSGTTASAASH